MANHSCTYPLTIDVDPEISPTWTTAFHHSHLKDVHCLTIHSPPPAARGGGRGGAGGKARGAAAGGGRQQARAMAQPYARAPQQFAMRGARRGGMGGAAAFQNGGGGFFMRKSPWLPTSEIDCLSVVHRPECDVRHRPELSIACRRESHHAPGVHGWRWRHQGTLDGHQDARVQPWA